MNLTGAFHFQTGAPDSIQRRHYAMNRPSGFFLLGILMIGATAATSEPVLQAPTGSNALTLQDAIRAALARAPEVALAGTQVERAADTLRETRSSNRPQVVTGTGLAYNNGFPLSIEGAAPSVFQVGVSQALFSKRNKNLISEAEEGIKTAEIGSESARNELAARTALVYYALHQARRLESLWSAGCDGAAREQELAETLLAGGKIRPLDVSLARTATAVARQHLLTAQEERRLAETELRQLTAMPETAAVETVEPQLDSQVFGLPGTALFQKALETHPEIRQAESALRARMFHVEAEKGGKYPRLELVSQYAFFTRFNNYQDYFNRFTRNNFLVGMSVQVPVFDGFQTSARVAKSRQDAEEARLRLERLKSELRLGIERSVSGLRIAKGAIELGRREVETAQEYLKIHQTLMEEGRAGAKELLNAQDQLRAKEVALLGAEKALFEREVELLQVTGALPTIY
jgi:outer membrane protein